MQAESCTTFVTVMFEFDTFSKDIHLNNNT